MKLKIIARDNGMPRLSAEREIEIKIIKVNIYPPEISLAPVQITNDFFLVNSVLTPRCFKQQVNYQEHLSVQKTSFQNAELCTYLGLKDMFKNPGYLEE